MSDHNNNTKIDNFYSAVTWSYHDKGASSSGQEVAKHFCLVQDQLLYCLISCELEKFLIR
jgi:hypothetical protein